MTLRTLLPQGLFWRLATILLAAVALTLAITAQFIGSERAQMQRLQLANQAASRIADAERMFALTDAAARPALARALAATGVQLDGAVSAATADPSAASLHEGLAHALERRLDGTAVVATRIQTDGPARAQFVAELRTRQGEERSWSTDERLDLVLPPPRFLLPSLIALLLAVGGAALVAVRWVTQPLSALAAAARALGTAAVQDPLAERGPVEVRQAARAFNDMSARIGTMVDEKTRMLAAISHDMRAPITRMRLRVEMLADVQARARLVADLDELRRLTDEALEFLRGASAGEPVTRCDLARVAAAVVQDAREAGQEATLTGATELLLPGRAGALRRCVQNLVDNALKHAGAAEVELAARDGAAWLWVRDCGPGLTEAELGCAFEPFFRGNPARGHAAGFGLGLPIARAIAREHGGEVTLRARPGGGLEVELRLPVPVVPDALFA
jgi:signal transduction histidine kinase